MSLVGSWMQTMAVGWLSLQLSDSAFVVGLVASVGAIPIVLFSMHAGAFVDHGDKLRIVRVTQSILLAQAAVLWLVTITGHVSVPILLVLAFVQGLCSAVEIPARQSMIIQLVGREDLQPAIALNSSGFNLARVIGPAIGGLVIARFGIAWCFGLNALSFVAVLWGLLRIKLPEQAIANAVRLTVTGVHELIDRSTTGAAEGLRHLAKPGPVRDLLALVTVGAVLGGPFLTIMPVIARDQLGLGAGGYGTLLATVGVGGLLGALLVAGPISHAADKGRVLMTAGLAFPTLLLGFAYTTTLTMAYVVLFATGVAMITFNALSNGVLQLLVEEKYRGRLMAFYSLVFVGLSQAVGSFAIGALARVVTAPHAIAASAVVLMLASLYALRYSDFWRRV
ncbi:MFS transporter [Gemmatimonas groenlandica]|uniref:MFS transporter n=2 Tax=Gemmatimonas groenlandica TaxID=2732249 RepID=A0A6M4IVH0_9BACT|nr:MFS transporter [Gemmatimonas groenlandica]